MVTTQRTQVKLPLGKLAGYQIPSTHRVVLYRALHQGWSKSKEVMPYTFTVVYEMRSGGRLLVSLIYSEPNLGEVDRVEALSIIDLLFRELQALPGVVHIPKIPSTILMQGRS